MPKEEIAVRNDPIIFTLFRKLLRVQFLQTHVIFMHVHKTVFTIGQFMLLVYYNLYVITQIYKWRTERMFPLKRVYIFLDTVTSGSLYVWMDFDFRCKMLRVNIAYWSKSCMTWIMTEGLQTRNKWASTDNKPTTTHVRRKQEM